MLSMTDNICEIVRQAETNYVHGTTKLGEYVDWSMYDTVEKIFAYLNSKHTSGSTDSLGREKPFFNIVTAAVNIWYRATDIDRKNMKFIPTTNSSIPLAFVANVILRNWMNENRFGVFLNQWGRTLAQYGSAVCKFIEKDGKLIPSVIPWNRIICDQVDFSALPKIEKLYKTPSQLKKMGYDEDVVENLIQAVSARKTLQGITKDNKSDFIEIYEVHGELPLALLKKEPDDKDWKIYRQQMHVVSFLQNKSGEYDDFTLYKGKETKDSYMLTHLMEEDGRSLSIGAVEYLFDAQWMQNHTVKNMKDLLDISSKLVFQTADPNFVNRNILSAIEAGDLLIHAENKSLTQINTSKGDIVALQNFGSMWRGMGQELTATPDAMRGITPVSGTPLGTTELLTAQSTSLFEIMTENKGLALEDMLKTFIIPKIKSELKHQDEILAILDDASIKEIDAMYIPKEAVKRFNERSKEAILNGQPVQPFNPTMEQGMVKQEMDAMGNKRSFVPDEIGEKQWNEIFSDFQWENIRVEITNENSDKQVILGVLNDVFGKIISMQGREMSPDEKMIFNKILAETAILSPMQFSNKPMPISTPNLPAIAGRG